MSLSSRTPPARSGRDTATRPAARSGCSRASRFHPRKIVTTGEGGAVTTDEAELAAAVRRLRHHGIAGAGPVDIAEPGLNYRLPDVLCALGIPQLERLESLLAARERVAGWYTERLEHLVGTPTADEGDRHGWQAYVVALDRRDEALAGLREAGIEAQIGTYAVHRLSAYRDRGSFPGADAAFERALALPFATSMTEDEVDRVARARRPLRLAHEAGLARLALTRHMNQVGTAAGPARRGRRPALPAGRPTTLCRVIAQKEGLVGEPCGSPTSKGRSRRAARARA